MATSTRVPTKSRPQGTRRVLFPALLAALLLIAGIALLSGPALLRAAGYALIQTDTLEQADAILVLAGDFKGERILKACEVARAGYAPTVLVSGPMPLYGQNEADLAISYATQHGCPAALLQACRLKANSTEEEARVFEPELRKRGIRRLLIVTSNYHTARAGRVFRRRLRDTVKVSMVPAPDIFFDPDQWWAHRDSQKTLFYEVSKTISDALGSR